MNFTAFSSALASPPTIESVLQLIELASADVTSIFGHITVDGSFADTLGNIFALSFVVRLAVAVSSRVSSRNGQ